MRLLMGEDWAGPYAFDQRTRPPFVAIEKKSSILYILCAELRCSCSFVVWKESWDDERKEEKEERMGGR